jgi:secondary thiamine-phosphate synthase enzyme
MKILTRTLERHGTAATDVFDLSAEASSFVRQSGLASGQLLVFVPGSTAAVTTIEFEPGALADLERAIERLAPADAEYEHNLRWGDGNGYAHVRAALVGPSLTVPIAGGELATGTWQQIVLLDFDNRPRRREILLQITGE